MKELAHIVEDKKKQSHKTPKYGMRKLSVGLVSCLLGYGIMMSPKVVHAERAEGTSVPGVVVSAEVSDPKSEDIEEKDKKKETVVEKHSLTVGDEKNSEPVAAPVEENLPKPEERSTAPIKASKVAEDAESYKEDEAKVQNYKNSDLTNKKPNSAKFTEENNGETIEGVTATTKNPSATSEDKKKFGVTVEIDKETSERTYTNVLITDSKRGVPIASGDGELTVTHEKKDGKTDTSTDGVDVELKTGRQRGVDITTDKDFLEKVNHQDNKKTTLDWESSYTEDNPNNKLFEGDNYETSFSVNPYPNENKNLELIEVEGETTVSKVPVKGQYIKTGARIKNLGEEDYKRIVSEVYHPDGTVVDPNQAKAILVTKENKAEIEAEVGAVKEGDIVFKLPKGALQDPNSIFNQDKFKGIQDLSARFFARPRTKAEFEALVKEKNDEKGYEDYFYTETGAGTANINHHGEIITIDKQGIARYDHYNKVGEINVKLDDTRYYDQNFDRKIEKKGDKITGIKPDEEKVMEIKAEKEGISDYEKTADEMNAARKDGLVIGEIDESFIKKAEEQGWEIKTEKGDLSKFSVKAPKGAKAGDFIAIPIEYTYTNGSKDSHWFHFVVQESDNNRPEYKAEVGYEGDTLTSTPTVPNTEEAKKKNQPTSYQLAPLKEGEKGYKDSAGNIWSKDAISVDQNTGKITVTVPSDVHIVGGENLFVPIEVGYVDEHGEKKTETVTAQFIARPRYVASDSHEVVSEIPFETKVIYDEDLDIGTVVRTEGEVGEKQSIYNWSFDSKDKEGDRVLVSVEETVTKEKKDAEIRIGVRPKEATVNIKRDVEISYDDNLPAGTQEVDDEGRDGVVTVKTTRDPLTGEVSTTTETTTQSLPKKIRVGTKTEGEVTRTEDIAYDVDIIYDKSLDAGVYQVEREGEKGTKEVTVKIVNSKQVGEATETVTKRATNKVIRVGTKNTCDVPPTPSTPDGATPTQPGDNTPSTPKDSTPGTGMSNKPSGDTSNQPGGHTPSTPGTVVPSTPSDNTPTQPRDETPGTSSEHTPPKPDSHRAEEPSGEGTKDTPLTENKVENATTDKTQKTTNTHSQAEDMARPNNQSFGTNVDDRGTKNKGDNRIAPQTYDPGIGSFMGLGSVAAAALAFIENKKRKNK